MAQVSVEIASSEEWQKGEKSVTNGANEIRNQIESALQTKKGLLIGRHGTIELTMILQMLHGQPIDLDRAQILERNAGVFPLEEEALTQWLTQYTEASLDADIMGAGWYKPLAKAEWRLLQDRNPTCKKIPLRSLEPYYCKPADHWTQALKGRRITVVSSFAKTMEEQLEFKEEIWPYTHETLLPSASWSFVTSYYAPVLARGRAEWPSGIQSWSQAVDRLETDVLKTNPDVVLIGCGGLGMILGHRLKQHGLVAVVMGGAIQVLFGIQGKRWQNHPTISGFWNPYWMKPRLEEVPCGSGDVEGGCYW